MKNCCRPFCVDAEFLPTGITQYNIQKETMVGKP